MRKDLWLVSFLHKIGLGWEYQKLKHWLGLYPKYNMSGRCMWCGELHK